MKEKLVKFLFTIVVIIQTILYYLGLLGIVFGVIALLFKNTERGIELLIGGASFIVIKYIIGIIFNFVIRIFKLSYEPKN